MTTTPALELVNAFDVNPGDRVIPEEYDPQLTLADYDPDCALLVASTHRELHDGEFVALTFVNAPSEVLEYETLVMRVRVRSED